MGLQTLLDVGADPLWHVVARDDRRARALADQHYSRQTPGAKDFMASGRTLVLLSHDGLAVWGAIENMDPAGNPRWRCSIFRRERECLARASDLVIAATAMTYGHWRRRMPSVPLQTEVDPSKTRHKRDPGRCFRRAGWVEVDRRRGLVVLQAPAQKAGG